MKSVYADAGIADETPEKTRLELSMVRDRERQPRSARVPEPDVASTLPHDPMAEGLEGAYGFSSRDAGQLGHRQPPTATFSMISPAGSGRFHVLDGQLDGLLHVGKRVFDGLALAVATGQCRHDGYVAPVRIGLEDDAVAAGGGHHACISPRPWWAQYPASRAASASLYPDWRHG